MNCFKQSIMLITSIHLKTSESFRQKAPSNQSEVIINAFIDSCKALDASIFEPYMEEDNVFEEKDKYRFLADLKALFDSFKELKPVAVKFTVEDGICQGCDNGKGLKIFNIKGWGRMLFTDQFAFVFERENGLLIDIFRCNLFCDVKGASPVL